MLSHTLQAKKDEEKRTSHKEVINSIVGEGSPLPRMFALTIEREAKRLPYGSSKFDPQKTNNKPRQIKKSVGVRILLKRQNTISLVCVDNIGNL